MTASRSLMVVLLAGPALLLLAIEVGCSRGPGEEPAPAAAGGRPAFVPDTKPPPPIRWVDSEVPAGTSLKVVLLQRLAVGSARPGDRFEARVTEAVVVGDLVAVPAGSIAHGVVVESAPGRMSPGGLATLTLNIERLSTPTGASAELQARYRRRGPDAEAAIDKDAPLIVMLEKPMSIQVKR